MGTSGEPRINKTCRACYSVFNVDVNTELGQREPFLCEDCLPVILDRVKIKVLGAKIEAVKSFVRDGERVYNVIFTHDERTLLLRMISDVPNSESLT